MSRLILVFFFKYTATTEIYTLSLHDALPIYVAAHVRLRAQAVQPPFVLDQPWRHRTARKDPDMAPNRGEAFVPLELIRLRARSEEHTSELQSRQYLVCRLLLEKKNTNPILAD